MKFDYNLYRKICRIAEEFGGSNTRFVPRIECADGFSMSVQAGQYLYSTPRENVDEFTAVEVGYPSRKVKSLMPYIDDPSRKATDTVYGYVPVEIVNAIVDAHGGLAKEKTTKKVFFGFTLEG